MLVEHRDNGAAGTDMIRSIGGAMSLMQDRFDQTLQAFAGMDACRVLDHQTVKALADSLGTETPLATPYFSGLDESSIRDN